MRNIRVKITRDGSNAIRSIALEEYLRGVVPSEIPASSGKAALEAQAIAARTYAAQKMSARAKQPFDVDDTTAYQAYRANNTDPRTDAAIAATAGQILTYNGKIIDSCVYTASNGGQTVSALERWGSTRAYLPEQDDPYDKRAGYKKNGHGVGLSQRGAQEAAKEGLTSREIIAFYYPGTVITDVGELFGDAPTLASKPEPAPALTSKPEPTPAPTPTPPPTLGITRTLKKGLRGDDVAILQSKLAKLGYQPGAADGIFGVNTETAVKALQKAAGIGVDGILGSKSLEALQKALQEAPEKP